MQVRLAGGRQRGYAAEVWISLGTSAQDGSGAYGVTSGRSTTCRTHRHCDLEYLTPSPLHPVGSH
jgi:hypothetical protein